MKRKSYNEEFKREAVKLVLEAERPLAQIARELGVNNNSLRNWVVKHGEQGLPGAVVNAEEKMRELEKEVRRLKMEREILKKATAFFAKDQL